MTTTIPDFDRLTLGVIGLGNMGGAIVNGVIEADMLPEHRIVGFDPDAGIEFAGRRAASVGHLCADADLVVLAVKPHIAPGVALVIGQAPGRARVVVSVAAGVSLATLRHAIGQVDVHVVRTMPNAGAAVGAAITAIIAEHTPADAVARASTLFRGLGEVVELPREQDIHGFTGLAGSGPAYVAIFAEALADAGVREGLSRAVARRAAAMTLLGAAELLMASGLSPADLKDAVSSPGGTTIAGIAALESAAFRGAVIDAVHRASARSRQLGGEGDGRG